MHKHFCNIGQGQSLIFNQYLSYLTVSNNQVYSNDEYDVGLFIQVSDSGPHDPLVYKGEQFLKLPFNFCWRRNDSKMASTLKEKNLLHEEQILSFES